MTYGLYSRPSLKIKVNLKEMTLNDLEIKPTNPNINFTLFKQSKRKPRVAYLRWTVTTTMRNSNREQSCHISFFGCLCVLWKWYVLTVIQSYAHL